MTKPMSEPAGEPLAELEPAFSAPDATPTPWSEARDVLAGAPTYWLTTVRPDSRPHVTTVSAVWVDDAMYLTTGETEVKARNLERNHHVVLTAGRSDMAGLDVIVEGDAERVRDVAVLEAVADAYRAKYDKLFPFHVRDGVMHLVDLPGEVLVFRLVARKAFGFRKGDVFSQTRWRF